MILVGIYCPPSFNFTEYIFSLNDQLQNIAYEKLIIGGDFSAKSGVWGKDGTHQRGEELVEFMLHNNLTTTNKSDSIPTFATITGKSRIDITLISSNMLSEVVFWKVLETDFLIDHRYVIFLYFMKKEYH